MTGYVHNMVDKKQSFQEFAMSCARAFGALVEMRDESMDAPIPEKFVPSDYHVKELRKANKALARLKGMSHLKKIAFGEAERRKSIRYYRDALKRSQQENEPLNVMLTEVAAWIPPTPDHAELKNFMTEQLSTSINKPDYWLESAAKSESMLPVQFYLDAVKSAKRNVEYHTEELAKEKQRAESRTDWLKQLRASFNTGGTR